MGSTAVRYLLLQGALVVVWWAWVLLDPDARQWFLPAGRPDAALLSFWLADLVCVVAGSLTTARLVATRNPRAASAAWFTSGSLAFGALWCLAVSIETNAAWWATVAMLSAALATIAVAVHLERSR